MSLQNKNKNKNKITPCYFIKNGGEQFTHETDIWNSYDSATNAEVVKLAM